VWQKAFMQQLQKFRRENEYEARSPSLLIISVAGQSPRMVSLACHGWVQITVGISQLVLARTPLRHAGLPTFSGTRCESLARFQSGADVCVMNNNPRAAGPSLGFRNLLFFRG